MYRFGADQAVLLWKWFRGWSEGRRKFLLNAICTLSPRRCSRSPQLTPFEADTGEFGRAVVIANAPRCKAHVWRIGRAGTCDVSTFSCTGAQGSVLNHMLSAPMSIISAFVVFEARRQWVLGPSGAQASGSLMHRALPIWHHCVEYVFCGRHYGNILRPQRIRDEVFDFHTHQ